MALPRTTGITDAELERQLREMREDLPAQRQRRRELAAQVAAYEARFGLPSTEIHDAIDDGRLVETLDVCNWIIDYERLVLAESAAGE